MNVISATGEAAVRSCAEIRLSDTGSERQLVPRNLAAYPPARRKLNAIRKNEQLTSTMAASASIRFMGGGIVSRFMISTSANENERIVNRTIDPVSPMESPRCRSLGQWKTVPEYILHTNAEILFRPTFC